MDAYTWCTQPIRTAVLEWLKASLATQNYQLEGYADLRDGRLLFELLQSIQASGKGASCSKRTIPAQPCARFARIDAFIQGVVRVGSIYSLNVGAILNNGDEQELCKAAVMLLFLGSLEHGSSILEKGTLLSPEHQLALQEILKIVQNKPDPLITLDDASPPRESLPSPAASTTPRNTSAVNPHISSVASATAASSPLLSQLMASPLTTPQKNSIFVQYRRRQIEVLKLQDERDNLHEDNERQRREMSDEIAKLTAQVKESQSLLSTSITQDAYSALEEELERVTKCHRDLTERTSDYAELQERARFLTTVTDNNYAEIEKLQDKTACLSSQLEQATLKASKYQEDLNSVSSQLSGVQEKLTETQECLSKREEEIVYLENIVASHQSKPSSPIVSSEENLGEVLLNDAQDQISMLEEKLASLARERELETQSLQTKLESLNQEHTESAQAFGKLQDECTKLNEKLCIKESIISEQSNSASAMAQSYNEAKTEISALACERDSLRESCCHLTSELSAVHKNKTEEAEQYQKKIVILEARYSELHVQHSAMSEQLAHGEATCRALREQITDEAKEATNKLAELEKCASSRQQELLEELKEVTAELEQCSPLKVQVADQAMLLEANVTENEALKSDLQLQTSQLNSLQLRYNTLEEVLTSTTHMLVDSSSTQKDIAVQLNRLQCENLTLCESVDEKLFELNKATLNMHATDKALEELQSTIESSRVQHYTEKCKLQEALEKTCAQQGILEAQLADQDRLLKANCAEHESLQSDLHCHRSQLNALQTSYDMLERTLVSTTQMLLDSNSIQSDIVEREKHLKSQNLALSCSLDEKVSEVNQLAMDLCTSQKMLQEALSAKESEDKRLCAERQNFQIALEENFAIEKTLRLQLSDKEELLTAKCSDYEAVQSDLLFRVSQLHNLQSRYDMLETVLGSTTEMVVHSSLAQSDVMQQVKNFENQNLLLRGSLDETMLELNQLASDLCASHGKIEEMQTTMEKDCSRHCEENQRLQKLFEEKCSQEEALRTQLEEQDATLKAKSAENMTLKSDLLLSSSQFCNLQVHYDKIQSVLESTTQLLIASNEAQQDIAYKLNHFCSKLPLTDFVSDPQPTFSPTDASFAICSILHVIKSLQESFSLAKTELQSKDEALTSNKDIIMRLESDNSSLNEEVSSQNAKLNELSHTYRLNHDELSTLKLECQEKTSLLQSKLREIEGLQSHVQTLACTVKELDAERENLTQARSLAQSTNERLSDEINSLKLCLQELNDKLENQNKLASSNESVLLAQFEEQKGLLRNELERHRQIETEHQLTISQINFDHAAQIDKLTQDAENANMYRLKLEKDLQLLKESNEALLQKEAISSSELKKMMEKCEDMSSLEMKVHASEESELRLNQRCADLTMHIASQAEKIAMLELRVSDLQCEVDAKAQSLAATDIQLAQIKNNCESLQNEKEQIKQDLLLQTHAKQTAELLHLKEQLENEKKNVENTEARLQSGMKEHQVAIEKHENEKLVLVTTSEDLKKHVSTLMENNQLLETKLASFNETNEVLDRYKVGYKEKKRIIEELKHELKLSRALCAKHKSDFSFYKEQYESLQSQMKTFTQMRESLGSTGAEAASTVVDESKLTMDDLESTALAQTESQTQRSCRPNSTRAEIFGDDEGDLLIDSTLKPGGGVFFEPTFGILGDSAARDEDTNARINEMKRRNAQYLPHMRSAYPIESQAYTPSKAKSDEIRESKEPLKEESKAAKESLFIRGWSHASMPMPPKVQRASVLADPPLQPMKVLTSSENIKPPDAPEQSQIKTAEAFTITNTPKDSKRKGLRAKLKGALSSTKK